jgi:hypothetical protein
MNRKYITWIAELAVIKWLDEGWEFVYDSEGYDDIAGYNSRTEVEVKLAKIGDM